MIRLLKTNTPANYVLMFVLMLILWAFKLIYIPTPIENYEYPSLILPLFPNTVFFKYLSAILAFALFYSIGLLLIKINSDLIIVDSAYQSPGVIYALFTGFFINSQRISPNTIASILLLLSLIVILYSYKKLKAPDNSYNAGLIFGLALLLNPKFIIFLPLLITAFLISKTVNWREVVILIMGVITPVFLFLSYTWFFGNLPAQIDKISLFFSPTFNFSRYNTFNIVILLIPVIWSLIAIISKYAVIVSNKVSTRKFQNICIITSLFFILFFISPYSDNESITILYPFSSILVANVFINSKHKTSILFLFLILSSLIFSQLFQISFYLSVF